MTEFRPANFQEFVQVGILSKYGKSKLYTFAVLRKNNCYFMYKNIVCSSTTPIIKHLLDFKCLRQHAADIWDIVSVNDNVGKSHTCTISDSHNYQLIFYE